MGKLRNKPMTNKSKKVWSDVEKKRNIYDVQLGVSTIETYVEDPKCLAFVASRYKFASKILSGMSTVLEIGSGDAFGAPIVAAEVDNLICTDIFEESIKDNKTRLAKFNNIKFQLWEFGDSPYKSEIEACYMIDVIEHIHADDEDEILNNIALSLSDMGCCLIGTPNITSAEYASRISQKSHINLKSFDSLRALGERHFKRTFSFSMSDEVVHTGFSPMSHYLWILCVAPKHKKI
jgi:2-polyprenyl-3-methyl-5-hydroxy-6-metoxy-1,4-benzoquinol methylase